MIITHSAYAPSSYSWRGDGRVTNVSISSTSTTPSFSATTSLSNTYTFTHLLRHCCLNRFPPSQLQCYLVRHTHSSIYLQPILVLTIPLTATVSTYQSISYFPHITNKSSTASPLTLSHITRLSSLNNFASRFILQQ